MAFEEVVDFIDNKIQENTEESIISINEEFSKKIKQFAQKFYNEIIICKKQLENLEIILQHEENAIRNIQQGDTNAAYMYQQFSQERKDKVWRQYNERMMKAAFSFQKELNNLLNQDAVLVYVFQDSDGHASLKTIDEIQLPQFLGYEKEAEYVTGRFFQNENFIQHLSNLHQFELNENFNVDNFNFTYEEVIWRFNYGRKRQVNLVLWLNPNPPAKWLKAFPPNRGDIKETYASILLDRSINDIKHFNDEKLDNNIHSFMQEMTKVDNESGLLKGDVVVGHINYAIKGVKASTLKAKQMVELALRILKKDLYTKTDLENQKMAYHEKAKPRNAISTMSLKEMTKWQQRLGKSIENLNKNNMKTLIQFTPQDWRKT